MKPEIISHESYQNFILKQLNEHYSNGILVLVNKDWALILKLWLTDLSYVSTLLDSSYSTKGPKARDPSAMMRSYLIFLLTRPSIGITEWVDELHRVPLYAILSGFEPDDIPGDGTPFETQRYPRSKSTCDCFSKGITRCEHPRIYSQADCNFGWDSSRVKHYNGYHLYMLSACDSHYDLPLYPSLNPASRHDSISLLITLRDFSQRYNLSPVERILLDAAHDAMAIYEVLDDNDIEAFIDLNPRTKHNLSTDCDVTIFHEGIPICPKGIPMKSNGFEKAHNRIKWRCPLAKGKNISCATPCSTATYGRTFHTSPKDNLRIFTKTPRSSNKWNHIYKRRTSIE